MDFINIHHQNEIGNLSVAVMENAEFVNPIEKTMNDIIDSFKAIYLSNQHFLNKHNKPSLFDILSIDEILKKLELEGLKIWKESYERVMKAELAEDIFNILESDKKDVQEKLLKRPFEFSTLSLQKFIFKAWLDFGFRYSCYRFEHIPNGILESEVPNGAIIEENKNIKTFGQTNLKPNELRNLFLHRKVTIAKFLDKGSMWHCFYYNYNSINGKETGEIPHIHYISKNWTICRNTVLNELKKRHHKFTSSLHILYKR